MQTRTHATATAISLAVVLATYGFLAWRTLSVDPFTEEVARVMATPVDPSPVRALLEDPRLRALVPIAPPPQPTVLGNTNPFPGPREPERP